MKVTEILNQIEEDGWILVRMKGSHRVYRHSTKSGIVGCQAIRERMFRLVLLQRFSSRRD
jgi:predicted RNA binding protein YcfA (HicA-like mRNA interferase family)